MTVEIEEVGVLNTMVAIPAEHAYYVAFVQMSGGKDWYLGPFGRTQEDVLKALNNWIGHTKARMYKVVLPMD